MGFCFKSFRVSFQTPKLWENSYLFSDILLALIIIKALLMRFLVFKIETHFCRQFGETFFRRGVEKYYKSICNQFERSTERLKNSLLICFGS